MLLNLCFHPFAISGIQEKLGILNGGIVYAVYDYQSEQDDELSFKCGDAITILRRGDEYEKDWWWAKLLLHHNENRGDQFGYLPRNLLGVSFALRNQICIWETSL